MFSNKEEFKQQYAERMIKMYGRSLESAHITEKYLVLGEMVREYASIHWKKTKDQVAADNAKQLYYFSMEFLIGRLMTNNMMNLGIYETVRDGLAELDIDLNQLEDLESDAGLGNGGLGRLAACFLDSLASLQLPGNGNCIRYQYGLFKQKIVNGYQVEVPDQWLKLGNVWEVRKPKHAVDVKFFGHVEVSQDANGKLIFNHVDAECVRAVPYDMPIIGHQTGETNTLRLWDAEASENLPSGKDFIKYLEDVNSITRNVYPDDSTEDGRLLRVKQEYFFVSAGLQGIVKQHMRTYGTMDNFHEKVVIQLNDTHPVLCIPELMRILMDDYGYDWDSSWHIVSNTMAYTNHTIMSEALEKWPVRYISRLLPRVWMIIQEIHRRFTLEVQHRFPSDKGMENRVAIIKDDTVHMANLAVVGSFSVNGVAALHTDIIKRDLFGDFVKLWPNKFNNKTNGITHRRWLLYSNPQLRNLLDEVIGPEYQSNPALLENLMAHVDNTEIQERFMAIKKERKAILAALIKKETGIEIDTNSIIDVQAKRLHAYKRQLLNILHVMYLYQRMKEDKSFRITPHTFVFAAKAAPAYVFAKAVIKLINSVANVVNNDPEIDGMLKVVFIPNYSVSIAEKLMNAADVSEQISTAGKEASGTGNMKFMMNGALTLGTLDGANVEIDGLVGRENDVIFGCTVEEVARLKPTYSSWTLYNSDQRIRKVVDSLTNGTWSNNVDEFKSIYADLMYNNDEYFVLQDFDAYVKAQEEVERRYQDRSAWARMCLVNIAKSGFFSSDRTIKQYADEVWNIKPVEVKKNY